MEANYVGEQADVDAICSGGGVLGCICGHFYDKIVEGDAEKLKAIIQSANEAGRFVSGIRFNSLGGNLLEGVKLANMIKYGKIATVVANGAKCASACFVAFAAGTQKFASYTASVGVHGASDSVGRESGDATVSMARIVKELGVPRGSLAKWS